MKLYLSILFGLITLMSSASISKLSKLNSNSYLVTEVKYSDGLEVDEDCNVRLLMGGLKDIGPYTIDGINSYSNKYIVTVVSNSMMDVHIYSQRRINMNLIIDNIHENIGSIWIHMPPTNDVYKTTYDWHMYVTQTNYWNSSSDMRSFNVGYVSDEGVSIFVTNQDPFYSEGDETTYFTSFVEIGSGRYFTVSCPINN